MMQHQVEDILEKVLNTLFQVVAVYACDRLKVQKKYYEVYWWFERRNKILEEEVRVFLKKRELEISVANINETPQLQNSLAIDEYDAVYKVTQYYWDSYQYHNTNYINDILEKLKLKEEDLIFFFNKLSPHIKSKSKLDFVDITEFIEKYTLSAFVEKDRLIKTLFKYFQIIYELKYENISLSKMSLQQNFLDLIKIIPYQSITSRSSIVSEDKANSNMRCDSLKSLMIINKLSKFL